METFNLGDSIAQMKVIAWQIENTTGEEQREPLIQRILELIDYIEIPELIGNETGQL